MNSFQLRGILMIVGLIGVVTTLSSYAANITVDVQAQSSTYMALSDGTYIPTASGDRIEIGTFASTPTDGSSSLAGWSVFGTGTYAAALRMEACLQPYAGSGTGFAHTQIYLVMYDNVTGVGYTQLGIYYVGLGNNGFWRFPANTDILNVTAIELEDLVNNFGTSAPFEGPRIMF